MNDAELLDYLGTNPERWAEKFIEIVQEKPHIPTDKGTMLGWFANAIEAGCAEQRADAALKREAAP